MASTTETQFTLGELRRLIREAFSGSVTVYRGMNGISAAKLQKMIGVVPDDSGQANVDIKVSLSKMGWWSDREGVALTYATTDSIRGPRGGYDVLLKGTVNDVNADGPVSHALRQMPDAIVYVTDIYYSLPTGGNRRENLKKLL